MTLGRATPTRRRAYLAIAAVAGVGLFAWTVVSVGPATLVAQLRTLAPVLPLIIVLAGVRFLFQAAGWRLAMPAAVRPAWPETFAAVVVGEAAGYFAWGSVSREPIKAMLVGHRLPKKTALAAALIERLAYSTAATMLIVTALAVLAVRYHFIAWFLIGLAATATVLVAATRCWKRYAGEHRSDWMTMAAIGAFAAGQEISNLLEAYVVLGWLGASPALGSIVVLEGIGRLLNSAGQFIPGKLGVTEATTAALAEGLRLGGAHGLSLALGRRARSLAWAAIGIGLAAWRAVNEQESRNDAARHPAHRRDVERVQAYGLLHRAAAD